MAANDYEVRGEGGFCPMALLASPVGIEDTTITIEAFKPVSESDFEIGMAVLINDEIFNLRSIDLPTLTVYRGCADTVRAVEHATGSAVWFFSSSAVSDEREYLATDVIAVKVMPFTAGSGPVPIDFAPPLPVTFNWRAFRPYPPSRIRVNGLPRSSRAARLETSDTEFAVTWAHRDRLLQADQLISDDEASIGPEVGTTYTARVFDAADNLLRSVSGITGTAWSYTRTMLDADFTGSAGYIELRSVRDGFESLQGQIIRIQKAGGLGESLGENLGG